MRAIAGHEATFVPAFMALFEHFDWKHIAIVSEKSAVPRGIHDALSADARRRGVTLVVEACKLPDRHLFYFGNKLTRVPVYCWHCLNVCAHTRSFSFSLSSLSLTCPLTTVNSSLSLVLAPLFDHCQLLLTPLSARSTRPLGCAFSTRPAHIHPLY